MDVITETLGTILGDMDSGLEASRKAKLITEKISRGKATYADALDYAREVSRITTQSMEKHIPDVLTDGKLYRAAAEEVVRKPMEKSGRQVIDVAAEIQEKLNEEAGIGIRAVKPELNQDHIDGIIRQICNEESYEAGEKDLMSQLENFLEKTVDDTVRENADFQYKAGMNPTIERIATGKCCNWCDGLVGSYQYDKISDKGNDVFRRHKNCHCLVLYNPRNGFNRVQNVHGWSRTEDGKAHRSWTGIDEYDKITREELIRRNKLPPTITMDSRQFGKKAGKHATDYGLNPQDASDRKKLEKIVEEIFRKPDEVRQGEWAGQEQDVLMYAKDGDVVVTKQDGTFITILRGGTSGQRFKGATKR